MMNDDTGYMTWIIDEFEQLGNSRTNLKDTMIYEDLRFKLKLREIKIHK